MIIEFEIQGKVKAKQSFKIGKNGFKYTPADVKEYANWVRLCFINKYPNWNIEQFKNKPLEVIIDAFVSTPKSFSNKKTEQALKGEIRPLTKPDADNIAKNIDDALNGIAYPDDKQITCLQVNKVYSMIDTVRVTISDELTNIKG
jgi:Holliday junction resolvase RusA-like endonuclease